MKRTTIWVSDEDRQAIRRVRQRYSVATDSDAIRLAVRVLAEARLISLDLDPETTAMLPVISESQELENG